MGAVGGGGADMKNAEGKDEGTKKVNKVDMDTSQRHAFLEICKPMRFVSPYASRSDRNKFVYTTDCLPTSIV